MEDVKNANKEIKEINKDLLSLKKWRKDLRLVLYTQVSGQGLGAVLFHPNFLLSEKKQHLSEITEVHEWEKFSCIGKYLSALSLVK
jgi:hypothetical protein